MKTLVKSEQELHAKFVEYGGNAKEWMRKCVLLLPEINRLAIWQKKGFGSIYEYAGKLAGMSRNTVDDALRILEKIQDKPSLRMVAEAKGLGAVRPVLAMVTADTEKFWARKAAAMSKSTLETYVRELKKQEEQEIIRERSLAGAPSGAPLDAPVELSAIRVRPGTDANGQGRVQAVKEAPPTLTLSMTLNRQTAEKLLKLKGQGDWDTLMKELLELREAKLASERPEPVVANEGQTVSRYIPAHIQNHVLKKTNGQCAYPGCSKPHKILHHTRRFALRPEHDSQTLAPLCVAHERLAHHGLIEHEQEEPGSWRVRAEADREDPTYAVDRRVMKYRQASSTTQ